MREKKRRFRNLQFSSLECLHFNIYRNFNTSFFLEPRPEEEKKNFQINNYATLLQKSETCTKVLRKMNVDFLVKKSASQYLLLTLSAELQILSLKRKFSRRKFCNNEI
jgi:hypothetical protein